MFHLMKIKINLLIHKENFDRIIEKIINYDKDNDNDINFYDQLTYILYKKNILDYVNYKCKKLNELISLNKTYNSIYESELSKNYNNKKS